MKRRIIRARVTVTAANYSPAVASRRAKKMFTSSGFQRSWLHSHKSKARSHIFFVAADAQLCVRRQFQIRLSCSRGGAFTQYAYRTKFVLAKQWFLINPPVVRGFCSKLIAPNRGTFLAQFVCGANKIECVDD